MKKIGDQPDQPERELIEGLWHGHKSQPVTARPEVTIQDGELSIECKAKGASIGYKIYQNDNTPNSWSIYSQPFDVKGVDSVLVNAHRIGYLHSQVTFVHP